jgi:hypothetical protein
VRFESVTSDRAVLEGFERLTKNHGVTIESFRSAHRSSDAPIHIRFGWRPLIGGCYGKVFFRAASTNMSPAALQDSAEGVQVNIAPADHCRDFSAMVVTCGL